VQLKKKLTTPYQSDFASLNGAGRVHGVFIDIDNSNEIILRFFSSLIKSIYILFLSTIHAKVILFIHTRYLCALSGLFFN